MARARTKPYTPRGISRVPCSRCSKPSSQNWWICADGGTVRGVCVDCDVALNALVMRFMRVPDSGAKLARYREAMTHG